MSHKWEETQLLVVCVCVCASVRSVPLTSLPVQCTRQAPQSMNVSNKDTGAGFTFLLRIFPTQGSNVRLLAWQEDSFPLSHLGLANSKH